MASKSKIHVPSIRAVHQHTRAFKVQFFGTHHARQQDQAHMPEPAGILDAGVVTRLATLKQQLALTIFGAIEIRKLIVKIADKQRKKSNMCN